MKTISLLILTLLINTVTFSQTTMWGTVKDGGLYGAGYLYRTDSIGDNLTIVHHFNETNDGKSPGPIIQASNGKLYGMAAIGGQGVVFIWNHPTLGPQYSTGGTLFEYDPIIDSFKVLIHFNSTDPQYPTGFDNPSSMKLLEVSPGKLWCVFNVSKPFGAVSQTAPRYILSYAVATNSMTPVVMLPTWTTPVSPGNNFNTYYTGELYKAANGFIYGTTAGYSSCATTSDPSWGLLGSVIRINPSTNAFSFIRPFPCSAVGGRLPESNLTEMGGKLYGSTRWGGPNATTSFNGDGVIYEFDPATNGYVKKNDFPGGIDGGYPIGYILTGNNGKLYGTTFFGGTFNQYYPNGSGIIYEYDPASNIYAKKYDFIENLTAMNIGRIGSLWLKSSKNGKLYGTTQLGLFEYNTVTNQTRPAGRFNNFYNPNPIIEICMKPTYKLQTNYSYTLCSNSYFTFDTHSDNATSFIWKRNGSAVSTQTASALNFNQITVSDAGTWVCEITNDCGTTTTPTLTLVINTSGTGVNTSTINAIGTTTICPGSSITLNGNSGGIWNTGATTSSITISNAGNYQVVNTNTCGSTFSNIITIDTIPSPQKSPITFMPLNSYNIPILSKYFCPGDSVLLTGNLLGGVWNTGQTSTSIYVKDTLFHYVINSNVCKSVKSDSARLFAYEAEDAPIITQSGPIQVCQGDSVLLSATATSPISWYRMVAGNYSYVNYGNSVYAKITGDYYARISSVCDIIYSQPIYVIADTLALDTAIITSVGSLTFCAGGSVTLTSNNSNCVWNTGQTTQTITAIYGGQYYVTNHNSCSSVISAITEVSVNAAPTVSYTEPNIPVCLSTSAFTLAAGSPANGIYSGNGVTGNSFNPMVAGSGNHTISYQITDANTNCVGTATQTVFVDYDPTILFAGPSTTLCAGNFGTLVQTGGNGIWNTGQTGSVLSTSVAGTYYTTLTNICGAAVNSNTIQISINPLPPVPSITQNGTVLEASVGQAYQWYFNGNAIIGATSQTYTPTQNGDYTVYVSGPNGCYNVSNIYPYLITGIQNLNLEDAITIYPNPSNGSFFIDLPNTESRIVIINSLGQIIQQKISKNEKTLNFQLSETGVYIIEITTEKTVYIKKLIVSAK